MTRKALGRGLGALLSAEGNNEPLETVEVDPSWIEPCSAQPRTRFDEGALEELAESIKANGIVQPLLVRRRKGRFELVAGERRLRAAKLAGLTTVPVVVRDVADEKLLEIALVENIQREDLNPIEEAQAYKRLMDTVGLTQESLAARVGRDRSYITNYLRLLRLPVVVQELLQDRSLSTGHARALLGVTDLQRQTEFAAVVVRKGLSVRETEQLIRKDLGRTKPRKQSRFTKEADPNVRAFEAKLRRELGTQVRVLPKPGSDGGVLQIEYYSLNDLTRIADRLLSAAVHSTPATV